MGKQKVAGFHQTDWKELQRRILSGIDLRREAEELGVRFTTSSPNEGGWLECFAVGRDEAKPSAALNVAGANGHLGQYTDLASGEKARSFFELTVACGRFPDWRASRSYYAAKAGVALLSTGASGKRSSAHSSPEGAGQSFLDRFKAAKPHAARAFSAFWARKKPGVAAASALKAGVVAGTWFKNSVLMFPAFVPPNFSQQTGAILYRWDGSDFPEYKRLTARKVHVPSGFAKGLVCFGTSDEIAAAETIWICEGVTDGCALAARLPPDHVVVTACRGAKRFDPELAEVCRGKIALIVYDRDKAGQAGAVLAAGFILPLAASTKIVELPYELLESHGKDLRDYFAEGHTVTELIALAESTPVVSEVPAIAQHSVAAGEGAREISKPVPIEAKDDPHRLARGFLECLHSHEGLRTLHLYRDEFHRWDGVAYRVLPERELKAELTTYIKAEFDRANILEQSGPGSEDGDDSVRKVTRQLVGNVTSALESMCILPGSVDIPAWLPASSSSTISPAPDHVAMSNGVLDVRALLAGETEPLKASTPQFFTFSAFGYPFKVADCPKWINLLNKNLENDADRISLIQEWFGLSVVYDTTYQKFLVLEGEGANGKSVVCAALVALLGKANVAHVPLEAFGARFQLTPTLGKLANIASEVGDLDKVAEGFLKAFTSGDQMMFDRKGIPPVNAAPTARLVLATNNRPRFSDRSGGLWRRMLLVPFRIVIPEAERVAGMDKPEWWEASGELPGIFRWSIAGLSRLRERGRFTEPSICREALAEYRAECNPAGIFIKETVKAASEAKWIIGRELYGEYQEWCASHGYRPLADGQLGKEIARAFRGVTQGQESVYDRAKDKKVRVRVYRGITRFDDDLAG